MHISLIFSIHILLILFFSYLARNTSLDDFFYWLNFVGFISAGIGATGFFFINTQITKVRLMTNLCGQTNMFPVTISEWWCKNKIDDGNFRIRYKPDGSLDDSAWSTRAKVAFWLAENGGDWCFLFVFCGFLAQLVFAFWTMF